MRSVNVKRGSTGILIVFANLGDRTFWNHTGFYAVLWQEHGHGIVRVSPPPHSNGYKRSGLLHDRKVR